MRIAHEYSHLNGKEWLLVHRPQLWNEIEAAIVSLDAASHRTKISKERAMRGKRLYSPSGLNEEISSLLGARGWHETRTSYWVTGDQKLVRQIAALRPGEQKRLIEEAGLEPISSYNQTDFVKDRVAVEVQFGKYAFIAYDLFVKHLAFYVGDEIDVGIEIVPTKKMQAEMSSGPGYYEWALFHIARQGRTSPPVPLVLLGVEPD